jgi:alpha-1,2-mannosyltransferase
MIPQSGPLCENRSYGGPVAITESRPARAERTHAYRWLVIVLLAVCGGAILVVSAARVVGLVNVGLAEGDDFAMYWGGASSVAAGHSPYAWLAENRPLDLQDYHYPPLLALLLAPLTGVLAYPAARWAWLLFSLFCLAASGIMIWHASGLRALGAPALALTPFAALLPWTTTALGVGQLSPQLLLLIAGAYAALVARRPLAAGGLIAGAAYLKSFPALLGGYLLLRRQWRAALGALATGLVLVVVSLLVLGWEPHWTYLARVVPLQTLWVGGSFNVSLGGFLTRLLLPNEFTTPVVDAGVWGRAGIALADVAVLAASAYAVWRAGANRVGEATAYALAVVAMLLVSPINGQYNLVIVALPLAVAAARVQGDWPRHLRWLLLAGLLLGCPVELYDLFPMDPMPWRLGWGNLLTSGPLFGLLALWGLLVRLCLEPSADSPALSSEDG